MIDFKKQYIIQAISIASNNLRLSTDKIETVAILREHFEKCEHLEDEIKRMKTKTEFSKFAIKLWEAYQYISSSRIDFLKIGEIFKEHSHNLVMELSNLLDVISPEKLRELFVEMNNNKEISVTLSEGKIKTEIPTNADIKKIIVAEEEQTEESKERNELREELILGEIEDSDDFDFDNFEEEILKPITKLEFLLKNMVNENISELNLKAYSTIMKKNAALANEIGFTILTDMHTIFYTAFDLVRLGKLKVDKNLVESLRACLIVIVAVVRGKDVDITDYLNKAENLGKFLELN